MIGQLLEFIKELGFCKIEEFRYNLGLDLEISDKLKKKLFSIKNLKFKTETKTLYLEQLIFLKNRSDLICLIKNTKEGVVVCNLIKSYHVIKSDLLDLVKYTEKDRILILIKSKKISSLCIFSYNSDNYISVSDDSMISWYSENKQ